MLVLIFSPVLAIQNDQKHQKGARFRVLKEFGWKLSKSETITSDISIFVFVRVKSGIKQRGIYIQMHSALRWSHIRPFGNKNNASKAGEGKAGEC